MHSVKIWLGLAAVLLAGPSAIAQVVVVPPFTNRGVTSFDPQIDVVNSGVLHDVQAVVSHDRRYVTINARPSVSQVIRIEEFTFQTGDNRAGFVGLPAPGPVAGGGGAVGGGERRTPDFTPGLPMVNPTPSLLEREGVTRIR